MVVPVSQANDEQARNVQKELYDKGFDLDCSDLTFNKKIRNAETGFYFFILVVGNKESEDGTINVRKANKDDSDLVHPFPYLNLFNVSISSMKLNHETIYYNYLDLNFKK